MIYALIIGIDRYISPNAPTLHKAAHDAAQFSYFLEQMYGAKVTLLLDVAATRTGILAALAHYADTLQAEDTFLLYFSGHGAEEACDAAVFKAAQIEGFVCYDSMQGGVPLLGDKELRYLLFPLSEKIRGKLVVVTDCCHSGSIVRGFTPRLAQPTGQRAWQDFVFAGKFAEADFKAATTIEQLLPLATQIHVAACEPQQLAYENEEGGMLTTTLLATLRQRDTKVSYAELHDVLRLNLVPKGQSPQIRAFGVADLHANFLTNERASGLREAVLKWDTNTWLLATGAQQGWIDAANFSGVALTAYSQGKPLPVALSIADKNQVLPTSTKVTVTPETGLDKKQTYTVALSNIYPPLSVYFDSQLPAATVAAQRASLEKQPLFAGANIRIVSPEKADYCIWIDGKSSFQAAYMIFDKAAFKDKPRVEEDMPVTIKAYDAARFSGYLEAIQAWRRVRQVQNVDSGWRSALPIGVEVYNAKNPTEVFNTAQTPKLILPEGTQIGIRLVNNDGRKLYIGAVLLTAQFGLYNNITEEDSLPAKKGAVVELLRQAMDLQVSPHRKDFGYASEPQLVKIMVSTQPVEVGSWKQPALPNPIKTPAADNTKRSSMRSSIVALRKDDWIAVHIAIDVQAKPV